MQGQLNNKSLSFAKDFFEFNRKNLTIGGDNMKKKSWSHACSIRRSNRSLRKDKRLYKQLRHKRARFAGKGYGKYKDPKLVYKTTDAWTLI